MDKSKRPVTVSLTETDMISGRRAALRSMLAKTGIVAAAVVTAAATVSTAHAADRHSQTDHDTGRGSDEVNQTDND